MCLLKLLIASARSKHSSLPAIESQQYSNTVRFYVFCYFFAQTSIFFSLGFSFSSSHHPSIPLSKLYLCAYDAQICESHQDSLCPDPHSQLPPNLSHWTAHPYSKLNKLWKRFIISILKYDLV